MTPRQRGVSLLFLIGVGALLAVALFAGFHLVSILYGVVHPPLPPIYSEMTEIVHENHAYGVDAWRYESPSTAETIAEYYKSEGATCLVLAPQTARYTSGDKYGLRCTATRTFSIFSMNYEVVISPEARSTGVRVFREVFWIGTPPTTNP